MSTLYPHPEAKAWPGRHQGRLSREGRGAVVTEGTPGLSTALRALCTLSWLYPLLLTRGPGHQNPFSERRGLDSEVNLLPKSHKRRGRFRIQTQDLLIPRGSTPPCQRGASTLQASRRPEKVRSRGQCPGWGDEVWAFLPFQAACPTAGSRKAVNSCKAPSWVGSSGPKSMAGQEAGKDPKREKATVLEVMASLRGPGPRDKGIRQAPSRVGGRSLAPWGPDLTRNH